MNCKNYNVDFRYWTTVTGDHRVVYFLKRSCLWKKVGSMWFGSSNEVGIFAGKVTLVLCWDEDLCVGLSLVEIDGGVCMVLRDAASSGNGVKASVLKVTTGFWGWKLNAVQCKSNCFLVSKSFLVAYWNMERKEPLEHT